MTDDGQTRSIRCEEQTTDRQTRDVRCPFFLVHSQHEIHCEAYEERCRSIMRYRLVEDKKTHMKLYCCTNYQYCEHYVGLMNLKYGED